MSTELTIASEKLSVNVLTYGATLSSVKVAAADGTWTNVVLGLQQWERPDNPCLNCTIGRIAGRTYPEINFDGNTHKLPGCDGGGGGILPSTNLHGGMKWNHAQWSVHSSDSNHVEFKYTCEEPSLPGTVTCRVRYAVQDNMLMICYNASGTETTPISLTNHAYWNLSGDAKPVTEDHELKVFADKISIDNGSGDGLATGETKSVLGTVRDMTTEFVSMRKIVDSQATENPAFIHGEEYHLMDGEELKIKDKETFAMSSSLSDLKELQVSDSTALLSASRFPRWF